MTLSLLEDTLVPAHYLQAMLN